MTHESPYLERVLVADARDLAAVPTRGIARWHIGKLAILWFVAVTIVVLARIASPYPQFTIEGNAGLILAAGILMLIGSVIVTWRWFTFREDSGAPKAATLATARDEVVESLVWAGVITLRRLQWEEPTINVEGERRLGADEIRREGFALVFATVKFGVDLIIRGQPELNREIAAQCLNRLGFLVAGPKFKDLTAHAIKQLPVYIEAVNGKPLEQFESAIGRLWGRLFPSAETKASALAMLVFTRLFKYVVGDILITISKHSERPITVSLVDLKSEWMMSVETTR